jgi:YtxH-like protein
MLVVTLEVTLERQLQGQMKGGRTQIMTLDKTLKYAGLAIAGGAVGAAIGILIAPASGAETRRLISDRIESERDEFLKRLRRDPRREEGYPYSVISA